MLEGNVLRLLLEATTSAPTPVNLSAHPYFNLAGADALDINDHVLEVFASHVLPTDDGQIPTGEIRPVSGTPFDFRTPTTLGARIRDTDAQMMIARGYDHCFVLDGAEGTLRPAARLTHSGTGRVLEVETDRAGLQVYTSNSLNGSLIGHGGAYRQTAGLALEAPGLSRRSEPPAFPIDDPPSGRAVHSDHHPQVRRRLGEDAGARGVYRARGLTRSAQPRSPATAWPGPIPPDNRRKSRRVVGDNRLQWVGRVRCLRRPRGQPVGQGGLVALAQEGTSYDWRVRRRAKP